MGIVAAVGDAIATVGSFLGFGAADAGLAAGAAGAADAGLGLGAGFASDAAIAGGAGAAADAGLGAGLAADTGLGLGAGFASDAAIAGGAGADAASLGGLAAGGDALAAGVGDLAAGGAGAALPGAGLAAAAPEAAADAGLAATPLGTTASALGAAPAALSGAPALAAPPVSAIGAFADPTSLAAAQGGSLFTGATTAATAADPLAATEATFAPAAFDPGSFGLTASELGSPVTSGGGSFLSNLGSTVGNFVTEHPLQAAGTGLSALGLGRSLLESQNPNPIPGMSQLSTLANELGTTGAGLINQNAAGADRVAGNAVNQGNVLENYLNSGTLPPAVQAALNQATQTGITNIKAQYAARGMPPGSTAELQEINALQQNAVIQGGTLAAQLYSQGVSLDQLAANIYSGLTGTGGQLASAGAGAQESLVGTGVQLNTGVNNAIANLASALGGGGRAIINGNTVTLPAAA